MIDRTVLLLKVIALYTVDPRINLKGVYLFSIFCVGANTSKDLFKGDL